MITDPINTLKSSVPLFENAQFQLYGGDSFLQSVSNDSVLFQWLEKNLEANPTLSADFKAYYDYDGFVLEGEATLLDSLSTDLVYLCFQENPGLDGDEFMTCATN